MACCGRGGSGARGGRGPGHIWIDPVHGFQKDGQGEAADLALAAWPPEGAAASGARVLALLLPPLPPPRFERRFLGLEPGVEGVLEPAPPEPVPPEGATCFGVDEATNAAGGAEEDLCAMFISSSSSSSWASLKVGNGRA